MSAGTSPRSTSIASATCSAAPSSARRSAGAWSSSGATSRIAGTARSGSATASCGRAAGWRCSTRRSKSAAARSGAEASRARAGAVARGVHRSRDDRSQRRRGHGRVPRRARLLRSRRVPGPPVPAHQPRRRARAARRGRRVLRRRGSDRDLQREDVRRAGDGDALGVPSHGAAARRDPALRHAASGAAAVEGARCRHPANRTMAAAGCRRWSGRCSAFAGWATCPASRFRGASSSSCAAAIRARSSRCSSTTGWTWCRWRRSPRGRCVSRRTASVPAATSARRWRWGGSTSAAATVRAERCYRRAAEADDVEVRGEALYRLGLRCRRSAASTRRRTSGGSCWRSATPARGSRGRRPTPVRRRGAGHSPGASDARLPGGSGAGDVCVGGDGRDAGRRREDGLRHRLARLDRKITRSGKAPPVLRDERGQRGYLAAAAGLSSSFGLGRLRPACGSRRSGRRSAW